MSQPNITMKERGFKHITEKERYQIEILLKDGKKPKEIASNTREAQTSYRAGN